MVGVLCGLQCHGGNVRQVCAARFLVDGADIQTRVSHNGVLGVDVNDGHDFKKNFVLGLDQFAASTVPASTFQVESVDVDTLCWRMVDVILHVLCHIVLHDHHVKGPPLVSSSDLLHSKKQSNVNCMYETVSFLVG